MNYLAVSKFDQYQHYKNRKPAWVKFYVSLLDPKNPLNQLPVSTRYLFDRLLLLAAEWDNSIPNDFELIAKLAGMPSGDCREGLNQLKKGRWIKEKQTKRRASKAASKSASKSAPPEREKELEREGEIERPSFLRTSDVEREGRQEPQQSDHVFPELARVINLESVLRDVS